MTRYYLTATLPLLSLEDPAPVSLEEFIRDNEGQLTPVEIEELNNIQEGRTDQFRHPFLIRWRQGETQLRNALGRIRAAAAKAGAADFVQEHEGWDMRIERVAAEAMGMDDPLARELYLDRFRMEVIEDLAFSERFEIGAVYAFALRLKIVERWEAMNEELGRENLESLLSMNLETAAEGKVEE